MIENNENIIEEYFTLPSKGKIYSPSINADVKLRSMTTLDEMKRLNNSTKPYKAMCDLIDSCITTTQTLSSYEMCLGDYQYLLHRLRVVTYGNEYKMECTCPLCRHKFNQVVDLDTIPINYYNEETIKKYSEFDLPVSKKHIRITLQSPKSFDDIADKVNDDIKAGKKDKSIIYTLMAIIVDVDNKKLNPADMELFIQNLSMRDVNTIFQYSEKLNDAIGLDTRMLVDCEVCREVFPVSFRTTSEFFRPTLDI